MMLMQPPSDIGRSIIPGHELVDAALLVAADDPGEDVSEIGHRLDVSISEAMTPQFSAPAS
jgi:hypothetical protein